MRLKLFSDRRIQCILYLNKKPNTILTPIGYTPSLYELVEYIVQTISNEEHEQEDELREEISQIIKPKASQLYTYHGELGYYIYNIAWYQPLKQRRST